MPDLLHLQDELKLAIEGINGEGLSVVVGAGWLIQITPANLLEFKFGVTGKSKTCSLVLDHSSRLYKGER